MSAKPSPPSQFLNGTNYQKVLGFFRQHYTTKLGTNALPERMDTRLQKTVQHYMTEISRIHTGKPLNALNQEVLKETTSSMDMWLKKQEAPAAPTVTTVGAFSKPDDYSRLFEDTPARYESMMAERSPPVKQIPAVPDFRLNQDEDEEDPVILMQRMQKQRDDSARTNTNTKLKPPRMEIQDDVPSASNPIPPQAERAPPLLAPRQQDYIIPQEDVVKYRETEYNIFLTSSDRDWLRNNGESRYNFTVNFNTGSKRIGYPYNASLQERFRNIQRIEFVKAILPIESLTTLPRVSTRETNGTGNYDLTRVINVFSLPFLGVRIAELNNNGFSTKPEEDNTFAIVQYDTTWGSDMVAPALSNTPGIAPLTKSGYTGVIPKFLKTQKVYTPTPLATLQKLSIRMESHSGELLSPDSDVLFIKRICMSNHFTTMATSSSDTNYAITNPQNSYIFIQTHLFFPFSAVAEGDLIQFQGYTPITTSGVSQDFANFINRPTGHYVVATAYTNTNSTKVTDGRNNDGYCNVIILRSRFKDPSLGLVARDYFGGDSGAEDTFADKYLDDATVEPDVSGAALINMSRQTHVVLRLITRDMDSSTNIRPDNV